MARRSLQGGLLGALIGFFVGGPAGAFKGAVAGYQLGTAFEDTVLPPGPKLENTSFNESAYGRAINRIYGKDVVSPTIVWMQGNELIERTRKETFKNKLFGMTVSKTEQEITEYFATFMCILHEGVGKRIEKVWFNDQVVYEEHTGSAPQNSLGDGQLGTFKQGGKTYHAIIHGEVLFLLNEVDVAAQPSSPFRFFRGDLEQLPDPKLLTEEGADAPAYRGFTGFVIEELALTNEKYSNQIPQIKCLVERTDTALLAPNNTDPSLFVENVFLQSNTGAVNNQGAELEYENALPFWKYGYDNDSSPLSIKQKYFSIHAINDQFLYTSWCVNEANGSVSFPNGQTGQTFFKSVTYSYTNSNTINKTAYTSPAYPIFRTVYKIDGMNVNGGSSAPSPVIGFEEEVWLYPFDFPFKDGFNNYTAPNFAAGSNARMFVKPVLNSPNIYLIIWSPDTGSDIRVSIGKAAAGRMSIYTLDGLDLNEGNSLFFGTGGAAASTWTSTFLANHSKARANAINAVMFRGKIFIFMRYDDFAANPIWFPGLIIVPIANLTWHTIEFEQRDKIKLWFAGVFNQSGNTYTINANAVRHVNRQFITNWVWNKDYQYDALAPCYETGRLFGFNNNTAYSNSAKVNISTINSQSTRGVFQINTETGALVTDFGTLNSSIFGATGGKVSTMDDYRQALLRVIEDKFIIFPHGCADFTVATTGDYAYVGWDENVTPNNSSNDPQGTFTVGDTTAATYNVFPVSSRIDYADHIVGIEARSDSSDTGTHTLAQSTIAWLRKFRFFETNIRTSLQSNETVSVSEILEAEILRTGFLTSSDLDFSATDSILVDGLTIPEPSSISALLKTLQEAFLFDLIEEDYKLKTVLRSGANIKRAIGASDLQAAEVGQQPFEIKPTVPISYRAPSSYTLSFRDSNLEYETGTVQIDNPASSENVTTNVTLPIVMQPQAALRVLEQIVRVTESVKQGTAEIWLTFKHSDLEVSNFIDVTIEDGSVFRLRIVDIEKGRPGIVKIVGQIDDPDNYGSDRTVTPFNTTATTELARNPALIVIDSIPFEGADDGAGFWLGTYNLAGQGNAKAMLMVSRDNGKTFDATASLSGLTSVAYCTNSLTGSRLTGVFDSSESLNIRILAGGAFVSQTQDVTLQNENNNTFFYGRDNRWELIKIQTFTDNGDGTFTATKILSGYKGTTQFMSTHEVGDFLIAANAAMFRFLTDIDDLGKEIIFRVTGPGRTVVDAVEISRIITATGRLPLPPVDVTGFRDGSNDWQLSWKRQARFGIEWRNRSDVLLDEDAEKYNIYILDGGNDDIVVRTISVTEATNVTYTSAQQTTDWGSVQSSIKVAVAQFSDELNDVGFPTVVTL